jgi:uncharacterized RDD family membrane protein YckC
MDRVTAGAAASIEAAIAPEPVAARPPLDAAPFATPVRYGGFWRRLFAALVDMLVFIYPNMILRTLAGLPATFSFRPAPEDEVGRSLMVNAIQLLLAWWYCARMESSRWQGTLGQQLMALRVTDVHGRRISFLRASGRYFAQTFSVLLCGLGYFVNLWTPRRQTLHDLVSGCVFVRAGGSPESAAAPTAYAGPRT